MADEPAAADPSKQADTRGAADGSAELRALHEALAELLAPVARLAVARGLPFAAAQELLKRAFVESASDAHPGVAAHRKVSRIATATGINRREVTRLTLPAARGRETGQAGEHGERGEPGAPTRRLSRSLASEVCAHWRTHPDWRDATGQPRVLPRQGAAPSFEALSQTITRDRHPRSLLDELVRLGLARIDENDDTVALVGDAFVPSGDRVRMLGLLGDNVGDHLRAAVDNVLATGRPPHLEQALFADGLSAESLEALRPLMRAQWAALRQALVPALEARVEADKRGAAGPRARVRVGLYAYHEMPEAQPATPRRPRRTSAARRVTAGDKDAP